MQEHRPQQKYHLDYTGPQQLTSTYESLYEDNKQFTDLVEKPAIERYRQENKADFQDKALLNNRFHSFIVEDDFHDFFKNHPD